MNKSYSLRIVSRIFLLAPLFLGELCFASGASKPALYPTDGPMIEVHGHRGARARRSENTLPAFEYALSIGADVLELDLGITKDGEVVISHDPEVNHEHCLDENGKAFSHGPAIFSITLAQLKKYDCGRIKNPNFPNQVLIPGTRYATFDELMEMLQKSSDPRAKTINFNIETKQPDRYVGSKRFAEIAIEKIKKWKILDRSILQSFDFEVLREAKKIEPKLRLSALVEGWNQNSIKIAKEYQVDIISPIHHFVNEEYVRELHAMNVKVAPWTVDSPADWSRMAMARVDAIITDDPEALIAFLKEKGLRK